jgi:hypothetical protein
MNSTELWHKVGHLFNTDDGSLPDIFIDDLSNEEIVTIYDYVMTQATIDGNATAWSLESEKDIPIRNIENPATQFIENRIESFRHLIVLKVGELELPSLSVCVGQESIEFDYRMGKEWNEKNVSALFRFLSEIQLIAPNSKIHQADEGGSENPSSIFQESLHEVTKN